jgi:hypothetical protein
MSRTDLSVCLKSKTMLVALPFFSCRHPSCWQHDFSSPCTNAHTKDMFRSSECTRSVKIIRICIRLPLSSFACFKTLKQHTYIYVKEKGQWRINQFLFNWRRRLLLYISDTDMFLFHSFNSKKNFCQHMNKERYVLNVGNILHLLQNGQLMHSHVTSMSLIHDCCKYTVLSGGLKCVF